MPFTQLVIGPPGSGKSTYCDGMQQFMTAIQRPCSIVNLDPANDNTSYSPALDVRDLVTLDEIMEAEELGPNGGVLYALEELEHNMEWLEERLRGLGDNYVLFDCPGQVELFTHHSSLRNIFFRLQKLGYRLVVLHLTDSYSLTLPTLYISTLLQSLRAMLQLDLAHINVITKIDNLASFPPLPLPLSFYTEARSLEHLLPHLAAEQASPQAGPSNHPPPNASTTTSTAPPAPQSKYTALNAAIIQLIDEFGLVGFETLAVEDRQSMAQLLQAVDRAGGYAFGGVGGANETVWQVAVREGGGRLMEARDVEERWVERRGSLDEAERGGWEEQGRVVATERAKDGWQGVRGGDDAGGGHSDDDLDGLGRETVSLKDNGIKVVRKQAGGVT